MGINLDRLVTLPRLRAQHFQHSADIRASAAMKQVPGLGQLIKLVCEAGLEKLWFHNLMTSNIRVTARQYPSLNRQFVRLAEILEVQRLPALYVSTTPQINAFAMGMDSYAVVLCSGLLDILDEDEVLAIMAHELGHVKCEHQQSKTIAHLLQNGALGLLGQAKIPGLDLILSAGMIGLQFAVMDWSRKAEFSCDRAAVLAIQDPDIVARALSKIGGFSRRYAGELDLDAIEHQCDAVQDEGKRSIIAKAIEVSDMLSDTHPYPVLRVKEVRVWGRSPTYSNILAGRYPNPGEPANPGSDWSGVTVDSPRCRTCPRCGYPCGEDFAFCPSCQTNVRSAALACTGCRAPVETDWKACMYCGSWLEVRAALPS